MCLFFRDFRRVAPVHGSPVTQYIVPAHQQPHIHIPAAHSQYGAFSSPSTGPPPAHQSPRHVQYTTHPLPAHVHPVLHSPGLHSSSYPVHAQYAAPTYVNSPTGGNVYTAFPLSPTKTRQYQYLYQTFAGE